jgi:beta-fructofuranosidase
MSTSIHEENIKKAGIALAAAAVEVRNEEFRLHYHVMAPAGWMNDPNGLIHYKGEYHIFYQHYPYSDKWGPMHWGHAKSGDLVHWEHLPVALAPTEPFELGDKGGYGCWSGSAVEHDGKLFLFYTGHVDGRDPMEVQCMAASEDGVHFTKNAENPVIAGAPEAGSVGFRDPKVWKHGERWYMIIGSGKDGKGRALLYRSGNLTDWEYMGVAAESDGTQGDMWECPDLFPLGDKHVLVISPMNMGQTKNLYMVGEMDYELGVFKAEYQAKVDEGFDFYAGQTLLDDRGRRIVIGWMDMWGSKLIAENRGWYGAMTVPRELVLTPEGRVASGPVPELAALREEEKVYRNVRLTADAPLTLEQPAGNSLEFVAEFDLIRDEPKQLEIRLCGSEDEQEATVIRYDVQEHKLTVDRSNSGIGDGGASTVDLTDSGSGRLKLHGYLDRSSVEIFVNDGERVFTNRIYPGSSSRKLQISSIGGTAHLEEFRLWKLGSIWK